jgi:hypothetical protein
MGRNTHAGNALHASAKGVQLQHAGNNIIGCTQGEPLRGQGTGKWCRQIDHEGTSVRGVRGGRGQFLMPSGGQFLVSLDSTNDQAESQL